MRTALGLILTLVLLAPGAAAQQSLGELAKKEKARKAQQQQPPAVSVETDMLRKGKVELTPKLDPARKGDLDYLLQQLAQPRATPELLAAFVPLKEQAIPRITPLLLSADPLRRIAPATVLTILGNSEGLAAMARMLDESIAAARQAAPDDATSSDEAFQQQLEATREANLALNATRLGVWRFTEGSSLNSDQVIQRMKTGPPIEVVGGPDNGQRMFNRALRDPDPNLRLGAVALIRAASGGNDFGYQPGQPPEQNEAAIQQITTFLTTERGKVISALGTKPR